MTKDDVDAFMVDMKMLGSILGHNDEMIMEKFKDIFLDPCVNSYRSPYSVLGFKPSKNN